MKENLDLMGFGLEYRVVFILATIGGRQSLIFFRSRVAQRQKKREPTER